MVWVSGSVLTGSPVEADGLGVLVGSVEPAEGRSTKVSVEGWHGRTVPAGWYPLQAHRARIWASWE